MEANRTHMAAASARRKKTLRDFLSIALFVVSVAIGAFLLNSYVFQSFNVSGPSMEPTLHTGERIIVNKTVVSYQRLRGKQYVPKRGQIVVFLNPLLDLRRTEQYLVKRVIGLPGERVVVKNGTITVFNEAAPRGFNPDSGTRGARQPTSGNTTMEVPAGEIFVAGDNRIGNFSFDSRNGLGTVPLEFVEGPAYARVFPFSKFRFF